VKWLTPVKPEKNACPASVLFQCSLIRSDADNAAADHQFVGAQLYQEDIALQTRTLLVTQALTNYGVRAFNAAGPRVWNYLPTDLRQPDLSCSRFRQLQTFLFGQWDQSAV